MNLLLRALLVAALLVSSCGSPPPSSPQALTRDAVPVRFVSWNLRQLGGPTSPPTAERSAVLDGLQPDLIAVQEVMSEAAFAELTAQLPGFESWLGPLAPTAGDIRQGWLWRSSKLKLAAQPPTALFEDDGSAFPRPPLQATFEVVNGADFTAIAVHLKAGKRPGNQERRVTALQKLEAHARTVTDEELLLAGDFNQDFTDSRFAEAFSPFTSRPERYAFLTETYSGQITFLPAALFFDHVVTSTGLEDERAGAMPQIPTLHQQRSDFATAVSDHLPVVLDMKFQ